MHLRTERAVKVTPFHQTPSHLKAVFAELRIGRVLNTGGGSQLQAVRRLLVLPRRAKLQRLSGCPHLAAPERCALSCAACSRPGASFPRNSHRSLPRLGASGERFLAGRCVLAGAQGRRPPAAAPRSRSGSSSQGRPSPRPGPTPCSGPPRRIPSWRLRLPQPPPGRRLLRAAELRTSQQLQRTLPPDMEVSLPRRLGGCLPSSQPSADENSSSCRPISAIQTSTIQTKPRLPLRCQGANDAVP